MQENSEKSIRKVIGIECESIEGESWGVGRIIYKFLEEISRRPELEKDFRFILYFKKEIPKFAFLDSPLFEKKITRPAWASAIPFSFNLHYHIWMVMGAYRDKIDVLFSANYMLPVLWFKKSVVMLTDDVYYEMHNPQLPFKYRLAYGIFARWAAWRATSIMAISETSRQHVARLFQIDQRRIFTNYLGIDIKNTDEHRQNPTEDRYLLYVGQAFPRRHLKESLEAFERIAPEFPDLKFIAVGTDKYPSKDGKSVINSLIGHINGKLGGERIMRKEYVKDAELSELYSNAKAVVYISNKEAFGLPPIEAMSYGVPAVVSDTQLTKELFSDFAFNVAQPITVEGIADTLRDALLNEEKRSRISANSKHIVAQFTWKHFTDKFIEVFSGL